MRLRVAHTIPPLSAFLAAGCGGVTAGVYSLTDDDGGDQDVPTVVGDVLPGPTVDLKASPAPFRFTLTDPDTPAVDVEVWAHPPGGGAPVPALLAGNTDLDGLAADGDGEVHQREWDFATQLGSGPAFATGARLEVRVAGGGDTGLSDPFDVGNDAPVISGVTVPVAECVAVLRPRAIERPARRAAYWVVGVGPEARTRGDFSRVDTRPRNYAHPTVGFRCALDAGELLTRLSRPGESPRPRRAEEPR